MTNAQIILENSVFLMEQGLLKPTDQIITIKNEDGTTRQVQMPEQIHTYNAWKKLGYQVQKGEHAVAKFPIWKFKPTGKKQEEEVEDDKPQNGRCFMKLAFFFTIDQVKEVER